MQPTPGASSPPDGVPVDLPGNSLSSYDPKDRLRRKSADAKPVPPLSAWSIDHVEKPAGGEAPSPEAGEAAPITFHLRRIIGRGGMGEVWEAVQSSLGRVVAVKRLKADLLEAASSKPGRKELHLEAFRQEALTTAHLDHPNIVPVYDLGQDDDGRPLMAMKLIRGESWHNVIHRDWKALSPVDLLGKHIPILLDVAQAVSFAHARGVVHRDLKPGQVILGEFGEVLLSDWGLAVVFDPKALALAEQSVSADHLPTPTTASSPAGTPAFMAPEQTEKTAARVGPWTDIYLLGGILYFLLTLKPPHDAPSARDSFLKAKLGDPRPPREAAGKREVCPELADLAMEAMRPNPEERVPSAKAFVERLEDYLTGATRRRQSVAITKAVGERLAEGPLAYCDYSECLAELSKASALWEANPDIVPLRSSASASFAEAAIANRDLVLARTMADTVESEELRTQTAARVDEAEERFRRRERQRRTALTAVRVLLVVVGALMVLGYLKVSHQRGIAEAERDRARLAGEEALKAREDAQELVNFMLTDLRDSLLPLGQMEPLQRVGEKVIAYFEGQPAAQMAGDTERECALAYRTMGFLERDLGDTNAALELFERYRECSVHMAEEDPGDVACLRQLAQSESLIAQVMRIQGDIDKARAHFAQGLKARWQYLLLERGEALDPALASFDTKLIEDAIHGRIADEDVQAVVEKVTGTLLAMARELEGDDEWAIEISYALQYLAQGAKARGLLEDALRLHELALEVRSGIRSGAFGYNDPRYFLLAGRVEVARAAQEVDDHDLADAHLMAALEIAQEAEREPKASPEWDNILSATLGRAAQLRLAQDQRDEALEYAQRALELAVATARQDPDNSRWGVNLASQYGGRGLAFLRQGLLDRARGDFGDALARMLEWTARDPRNSEWRRLLEGMLADYQQLGKAYAEAGNDQASREVEAEVAEARAKLEGLSGA